MLPAQANNMGNSFPLICGGNDKQDRKSFRISPQDKKIVEISVVSRRRRIIPDKL